MRKILFRGKTLKLASHGVVKNGDHIYLREHEWSCVKENKDFFEVDPPKITRGVLPVRCKTYDLTLVRWSSPRLHNLLWRLTKPRLVKIQKAMTSLGVEIDDIEDDTFEDMVDSVMFAAFKVGWMEITFKYGKPIIK